MRARQFRPCSVGNSSSETHSLLVVIRGAGLSITWEDARGTRCQCTTLVPAHFLPPTRDMFRQGKRYQELHKFRLAVKSISLRTGSKSLVYEYLDIVYMSAYHVHMNVCIFSKPLVCRCLNLHQAPQNTTVPWVPLGPAHHSSALKVLDLSDSGSAGLGRSDATLLIQDGCRLSEQELSW